MQALARIVMLVERRTVEANQPVRVVREMAGHPIDNDAEPRRMAGVDEARKALRLAVAGARREGRERLIAPGATERMFGDRQQFDMCEAERRGIGRQAAGGFVPVEFGIVPVQP